MAVFASATSIFQVVHVLVGIDWLDYLLLLVERVVSTVRMEVELVPIAPTTKSYAEFFAVLTIFVRA